MATRSNSPKRRRTIHTSQGRVTTYVAGDCDIDEHVEAAALMTEAKKVVRACKMSHFAHVFPTAVAWDLDDVAHRRFLLEIDGACLQINEIMLLAQQSLHDEFLTPTHFAAQDIEILDANRVQAECDKQALTFDEATAAITLESAKFALRNRAQAKSILLPVGYCPDVPFVSAAYHQRYMREPMAHERACVFRRSCEGLKMAQDRGRGKQGFILTEFLLPDAEEIRNATIRNGTPTHSAIHGGCILCVRFHTNRLFEERGVMNAAYTPRDSSAATAAAATTTRMDVENALDPEAVLYLKSLAAQTPINTHQVHVGTPGAYRSDALLCAPDMGAKNSIGICGNVLRYKRAEYTYSTSDKISKLRIIRLSKALPVIRPFQEGRDTPEAVLRQKYQADAILHACFSPFTVTIQQIREGYIGPEQVFPIDRGGGGAHAVDHKEWLPPRWAQVTSPARRCALVSENPYLAALAARVNVTVRVLRGQYRRTWPPPSAYWRQQLRAFADTHCAFGVYVESLDITSDARLQQHSVLSESCPRWRALRPCAARIISERLLPKTLLDLVAYIDLFFKRSLTTHLKNAFVAVLTKAMPQPGQRRVMWKILMDFSQGDERFLRVMVRLLLCSLLGTYMHCADAPYVFRAQMLIWKSFTGTTRAELLAFLSHKKQDMLPIYALREFLIYALANVPAVEHCVKARYMWTEFQSTNIANMNQVRRYIAEQEHHIVSRNGASVVWSLWHNICTFLKRCYSDHRGDLHTVKAKIFAIIPHFIACARKVTPPAPPHMDARAAPLDNMAEISVGVWRRMCAFIEHVGADVSVHIEPLRKLGVSERGMRSIRHIMRTYARGNIMKASDLMVLAPSDFELFHAYLRVYGHLQAFSCAKHPAVVAEAQRKALRLRNHLLFYETLLARADVVLFCERCMTPCHVIVDTPEDTAAVGPNDVTYDISRRMPLCGRKQKKEICLQPLHAFHMIGQVIGIRRAYYSLCCACASLYKYNETETVHGYPVCGLCENTVTRMRRAGTLR